MNQYEEQDAATEIEEMEARLAAYRAAVGQAYAEMAEKEAELPEEEVLDKLTARAIEIIQEQIRDRARQ